MSGAQQCWCVGRVEITEMIDGDGEPVIEKRLGGETMSSMGNEKERE